MFSFLRRRKEIMAAPVADTPTPAPNLEVVITTMPEKFLSVESRRFWTGAKIWTLVVFLMAALIGGVYWLLAGRASPGGQAGA